MVAFAAADLMAAVSLSENTGIRFLSYRNSEELLNNEIIVLQVSSFIYMLSNSRLALRLNIFMLKSNFPFASYRNPRPNTIS